MNRMRWIALIALVALAAAAGWFFFLRDPGGVPVYRAEIVARHPHDPQAFTQGLFFAKGQLYESTGEIGTSMIRRVNLSTGAVEQQVDLPAPYFGEGTVAWGDRIYQLTWKDQQGFVYQLPDLIPTGTFSYRGEGWGLTQDGKRLIMSDGSSTLRFLDPETQAVTGTLQVTADGCPVEKLNELEWVDGQIYANIWQTGLVARIDPATGHVTSFLDLAGLKPATADVDAVANGVAWDPASKRLVVTGKRWPELYEVRAAAGRSASEEAAALTNCAR